MNVIFYEKRDSVEPLASAEWFYLVKLLRNF